MKSIVIINTPSSCKDCNCQFDYVCVLKDIDLEEMNSVPKWCPLRPLPSFKAVDLNDIRDVVMFCHGWNTCLVEITGETE